jgi:hypothetical protein
MEAMDTEEFRRYREAWANRTEFQRLLQIAVSSSNAQEQHRYFVWDFLKYEMYQLVNDRVDDRGKPWNQSLRDYLARLLTDELRI